MKARECTVPAQCALGQRAAHAYFADAWEIGIGPARRSMADLYRLSVSRVPRWINGLLDIRNRLARLAGLKDVGRFGALDHVHDNIGWKAGDRLDLFVIDSIGEDELVLKIDDSHLDVRLSLLRQPQADGATITVSTIVDVHNGLGKCYIRLIESFHRRIVAAMLRELAVQLSIPENAGTSIG
jgi:hypothetical protein